MQLFPYKCQRVKLCLYIKCHLWYSDSRGCEFELQKRVLCSKAKNNAQLVTWVWWNLGREVGQERKREQIEREQENVSLCVCICACVPPLCVCWSVSLFVSPEKWRPMWLSCFSSSPLFTKTLIFGQISLNLTDRRGLKEMKLLYI